MNFTNKCILFLFNCIFLLNANSQALETTNVEASLYATGALPDRSPSTSMAEARLSRSFSQANLLPSTFDNSSLAPLPKSQAHCGSCVIFAVHGLMEISLRNSYPGIQKAVSLNEQLSLDCAAQINFSCEKGTTPSSVFGLVSETGFTNHSGPSLTYMPGKPEYSDVWYKPQSAQCDLNLNLLSNNHQQYPFRPVVWEKISISSVVDVKNLIKAYGAVLATFLADDLFQRPSLWPTEIAAFQGGGTGHAIVLVGWDDSKNAFLARNSWGSTWGKSGNGHFWISYNELANDSKSRLTTKDEVSSCAGVFGFCVRPPIEGAVFVISGRSAIPDEFNEIVRDPNKKNLFVSKKGIGDGVVTSIDGRINCGTACSAEYTKGSQITLTPVVSSGNQFIRWQGACAVGSTPNSCVVSLNSDQTVFAEFSATGIGSLDAVIVGQVGSNTANKLLINIATGTTYTALGGVFRDSMTVEKLLVTPDAPIIKVDPSYIIDTGIYYPEENNSTFALRIKKLQIDYDWLSTTIGAVQIQVATPSFLPSDLRGAVGLPNPGLTGTYPGRRPQCGGAGGTGGLGGQGGTGGNGKSRQYKRFVIIVESVVDPVGRLVPPEKIKFVYSLSGLDGGAGGNGGAGGIGGAGGEGGDGKSSFFECECGPGTGGNGGTGGLGGVGGAGGDAGYGANVTILGPQRFYASFDQFAGTLNPGLPGPGGFAGSNGRGGLGGARGASPGLCNAGGAQTGATGQTLTASAGDGSPGRRGFAGEFEAVPLSEASARQLQLLATATELDANPLQLLRVDSVTSDGASISWAEGSGTDAVVYSFARYDSNTMQWNPILLTVSSVSDRKTIDVPSISTGSLQTIRITATRSGKVVIDQVTFSTNSTDFNVLTSQTIGPITFLPPTLSVGGSTTASATANSGLTVTFTSTTPTICTVSGSTVTGVAAGTCTVSANQAGNATYSAAPQVTQNITVAKASQTIGTISYSPSTLAVGGTTVASATATSGLAVTFNSTTPTICSVSTSTVTGIAAGTCTVAADQSGNANYSAAPQVTANITVTAATSRLINISTRGQVSTGDGVMIGGFIISGTANKKVLIRAIGPNLANFGIAGTLPDPKLELFEGSTLIGSNDNWQTQAIPADVAAITATGLAPANVAESALLVTLKPGVAYTAVVTGVNVPSGVGIVEVFEADHPEYQLVNISTRGRVQSGEGVMIGGFIIQGDAPKTVLIRAVGPNLANFGVSGVLADPMMDIYRSSDGVKIASNDDWQTQTIAADVSAITATGLPPADPRESAILLTLPPGAYTAVVSGKNGGTGVGIVEVFAR